ncbi:MAG: hypothetical protein R3F31_27540 [Verrucomicrobiales bacterium]
MDAFFHTKSLAHLGIEITNADAFDELIAFLLLLALFAISRFTSPDWAS